MGDGTSLSAWEHFLVWVHKSISMIELLMVLVATHHACVGDLPLLGWSPLTAPVVFLVSVPNVE